MMATPPIGLSKRDLQLFSVKTSLFDVLITGSPTHPTVEHLQLLHSIDESPVFAGQYVLGLHPTLEILSVETFSAETFGLVELEAQQATPVFFEQQDYQLYIFIHEKGLDIQFRHENESLQRAISKIRDNQIAGRLNFRNEVGFSDLYVTIDGKDALQIRLEIFPAKLDYRKDYQLLLAEVNEEIYNLSFDFLRRTYQQVGMSSQSQPSLVEYFTILRHVFSQLETAIERVNRHPHYKLRSVAEVRSAEKVRRAGKENLVYLARQHGVLEAVQTGKAGVFRIGNQTYLPRQLIETRRKQDYDTLENRFMRWMLRRIVIKLNEFRRRWEAKREVQDAHFEQLMTKIESRLQTWLRFDWLQEVREMQQFSLTIVLQLASGYRDLYRLYLLLMKGLSIQNDLIRLSMKDMARLYEYWCFLKINRLLRERYSLLAHNVVQVDRSGIVVNLQQSRSAKLRYLNPETGEQFTLYYNSLPEHITGPSPTVEQRPDHIFSLEKHGTDTLYHFVFDAKYRLNPALPDDSYQKMYQTPGPEIDTINAMHRYRDAIVARNRESGRYERQILGAFVLFPYWDEEQFEQHHFYQSIRKVNVGAIPFLPNATRLMSEFLHDLIEDTAEELVARAVRQAGVDSES
jgi:predicted component of viral defense system (DUF524 family)